MPLFSHRSPTRKRRSDSRLLRAAGRIVFALGSVVASSPFLQAADLPPHLMARFTKQVQPLVLNKCGAGACHGGPASHAPHFNRGDVSGRIDRGVSLANIETLFRLIGPSGNASPLLTTISARHPASSTSTSLIMTPITTTERATLEQWLIAATGSRNLQASRSATPGTTTHASVTPPPNRFRAMLDAAANPAPLPPPQEPQGIILGKDQPE